MSRLNFLKGKRAIVTGASQGIGRAISLALAKEGCHLALISRSKMNLEETANLCRKESKKISVFPFDLSKTAEIGELIDLVEKEIGGIDILVNNAGIGAKGKTGEVDLEKWDKILDVNLKSLIHLTHHALKRIEKNDWGAIINIASIAGKLAYGGSAGYCASKHGVLGFTGSLFEDVREKNIKVCAICPGYVDTPMIQSKGLKTDYMIRPEDIAKTVSFVLHFDRSGCPTEIIIRPQKTPYQ